MPITTTLEDLAPNNWPSSAENNHTTRPVSEPSFARAYVYAPTRHFTTDVRLIRVVDQTSCITLEPYLHEVEIKSPIFVYANERCGLADLFPSNRDNWGRSFLQHLISYMSDQRIRDLPISKFFLVEISLPIFDGGEAHHPIKLSAIGAPGIAYPYDRGITEGSAIIGINWERIGGTKGEDLGIIIGWVEQFLGWNNGNMMARMTTTHVSVGDPTYREEISTLQLAIQGDIVDTVGTRFRNRAYHPLGFLIPSAPPGLTIRQQSLPEFASNRSHTAQLKRKEDVDRDDRINQWIKRVASAANLGK